MYTRKNERENEPNAVSRPCSQARKNPEEREELVSYLIVCTSIFGVLFSCRLSPWGLYIQRPIAALNDKGLSTILTNQQRYVKKDTKHYYPIGIVNNVDGEN